MNFRGLPRWGSEDEETSSSPAAVVGVDTALLVGLGVVGGLGLGLALGFLLAPRSGAETRHALGSALARGAREAEYDDADSVLGVG